MTLLLRSMPSRPRPRNGRLFFFAAPSLSFVAKETRSFAKEAKTSSKVVKLLSAIQVRVFELFQQFIGTSSPPKWMDESGKRASESASVS